MFRRVKILIASLLAIFAIGGVAASVSNAAPYLHQQNSFNACYEISYPSVEASFHRYGVHAHSGSTSVIGWQRYSATDTWIYIRWIDNTVHYSMDTWCRLKGQDAPNGGAYLTYSSLGVSAVSN